MGVVRSSASTSETAVVKKILHLIRRTWWSLRPAEISADEMALVTETLAEEELSLWLCMCRADRSHSVMVARRFTAAEPDAPQDALAGVFLHDVGKTVAGLSVPLRIVATLVGPRTKRFTSYHDHERIGAQMLREAGSSSLTIETALGNGRWGPALRLADDV
jgi:hypothetical protein